MVEILLAVLALLCGALVLWGMRRPGGIYQFPFLAGVTFASFVLPQLVGLANDPFLPPGALDKTIFMTILCVGMCYLGWAWSRYPMRALQWGYDDRRLIWTSATLCLVGAFFFSAISRLPEELTSASLWTGLPVAFLFFANLLTYGFALAMLIYVKTFSKVALSISIFAAGFYFDRILIAGRRGTASEFMFIVLLALWFQRGYAIPRKAVLVGMLLGPLILFSMGDYRSISLDVEGPRWSKIAQIDFLRNVMTIVDQGGPELTNAVYYVEAIDRNASFDYGLFHWNTLVFTYVPAQMFGAQFKESLMIPLQDSAFLQFYYEPRIGTTQTGISDAFGSFWYFGSLKFFLIAFVLSKLYQAAMRGHFNAQLLYMLVLTPALIAITHHTQWFFSPWVHMAIFLLPALFFARKISVIQCSEDKLMSHECVNKLSF